jgi:hypothetical protein
VGLNQERVLTESKPICSLSSPNAWTIECSGLTPVGRSLRVYTPASPTPRLRLGPKSNERWIIAQRPFAGIQAPPDADLVYAFCPKLGRAVSRPCISVKTCRQIATPVTACSFPPPNFSFTGSYPSALPRRHVPLLFKGSLGSAQNRPTA